MNDSLKKYDRMRIFGTENEYGIILDDELEDEYNKYISNGGRLYVDCGHLEYASPETSNPLDAVIWNRAGEIIAQKKFDKVYKNNIDSHGHTFGAHENYFTMSTSDDALKIVPFLATRQIYAGSGNLDHGIFYISQRSKKIEHVRSGDTTSSRAIINTKEEKLSSVQGWRRFHLILGDANMSEYAEFLKLGATGLVLDMLEDSIVPEIKYNENAIIKDLHSIDRETSDWKVASISGFDNAIDVQKAYLEKAKDAYWNRDNITNDLISKWDYALDKLVNDQSALFGKIDWVTKKTLIENYAESHDLKMDDPILRNIDLQYHDVDRNKGLFYALQKQGLTARIATDKQIKHAVNHAPNDTRAYSRGFIAKCGLGKFVDWQRIGIFEITDPFKKYPTGIREM